MPTIAVINLTGGVGKSTIAVHLARWLQRHKKPILVVNAGWMS